MKLLGIIGLIDEEETDWKLISIDINDTNANKMNDLVDVERNMPGLLNATIGWFRKYKIPEGKPENKFAFDGEPKNATFARHIVKEVHESWKNLMEARNTSHGIDRACSKCGFRSEISTEDAKCVVDMAPETGIQGEAPSVTERYHYCT